MIVQLHRFKRQHLYRRRHPLHPLRLPGLRVQVHGQSDDLPPADAADRPALRHSGL